MCAIAADGTIFWFLYRADVILAFVFAVQEPGQPAEMPTGGGMRRGQVPAAFIGVGMS